MTDSIEHKLEHVREVLSLTLLAAVPLWIEDLKRLPFSDVCKLAQDCAQMIAEKGDVLMFGSKTKGEQAAAFNSVAKGIAALSFVPGGVKIFGSHWEAKHPELVSKQP